MLVMDFNWLSSFSFDYGRVCAYRYPSLALVQFEPMHKWMCLSHAHLDCHWLLCWGWPWTQYIDSIIKCTEPALAVTAKTNGSGIIRGIIAILQRSCQERCRWGSETSSGTFGQFQTLAKQLPASDRARKWVGGLRLCANTIMVEYLC